MEKLFKLSLYKVAVHHHGVSGEVLDNFKSLLEGEDV